MSIVVRTLSREEFSQALAIRIKVFVDEQNVPIEEEQDQLDDTATHFGAFTSGQMVGTGRLVVQPTRGKIGRMAVAKEARGQGVGRALLTAIVNECRRLELPQAYLSAQLHAIPFYEQLGFQVNSGEYLDAGILHKDMILDIQSASAGS